MVEDLSGKNLLVARKGYERQLLMNVGILFLEDLTLQTLPIFESVSWATIKSLLSFNN